jgi:lactoylglutathione lyase
MSDPRPFQVLGVQQVALGSPDKQRLAHLWVDLFGLERIGGHRIVSENVEEDTLRAGLGPFAVEIDLMQPIDPKARPNTAEPALHHVGLWVDDLAQAVEWLTAKGVRFAPGGIRRGAAGHDVCFIHPKGGADAPQGGEGVLIELVQAPPEVIAAHRTA